MALDLFRRRDSPPVARMDFPVASPQKWMSGDIFADRLNKDIGKVSLR